ncbi:MAG: hypothetical protein QOF57_2603 [Frankiaceae bacterium]|nr:hypothetical protein [Frankiaceae bacterium]
MVRDDDTAGVGSVVVPSCDVSHALRFLELSDCEADILTRTGLSERKWVQRRGDEWSQSEIEDAAERLADRGLLDDRNGSVAPARDLASAIVSGANAQRARAGKDALERRHALYRSIMELVTGVPVRLGLRRSADIELIELVRGARVCINSYPAVDVVLGDLTEVNDMSLANSAGNGAWRCERDVVSPDRLRIPEEAAFFGAQRRVPNVSVSVSDDVPLRLGLFDDIAVVPVDPDCHIGAAYVITDAEAVAQVGLQLALQMAVSRPMAPEPQLELSERERAVLRLLGSGLTDEAVGRRLRLTDRSVRRVVAHLQERLCVDSRFALAVEATRRQLMWPAQAVQRAGE